MNWFYLFSSQLHSQLNLGKIFFSSFFVFFFCIIFVILFLNLYVLNNFMNVVVRFVFSYEINFVGFQLDFFKFCCSIVIKLIYFLLDYGLQNKFSRLGENIFQLIYLFVVVVYFLVLLIITIFLVLLNRFFLNIFNNY